MISVDGRRVHYRRCGEGPPLVMLHASPVSSQVFVDHHIPALSGHFCCIAPDTPGNGLSDPLPKESADIWAYVDALKAFLDAIDVKQCLLYGRHTGALIAALFAQRYPDAASFVYCDGYPKFHAEEVEALSSHYLPAFEPDSAGSFLPWLWFRYRDQHVFWSWFQQDSEHRSDTDVPSERVLHRGVLDFLTSGNHYIGPYRAAMQGSVVARAQDAAVPTCFAIRPGDSIYDLQSRHTDLPDGSWREELPRDTASAVVAECDILKRYAVGPSAPAVEQPDLFNEEIVPLFVQTAGGELFLRYRRAQRNAQKPLVVLPHIPGSGDALELSLRQRNWDRDVIIVDTPGHGDSALVGEHSVENYVDVIVDALSKLDVRDADLLGNRTGAVVAAELARRMPGAQVTVDEPFDIDRGTAARLAKKYQLDLQPSWEGAHLLRLWHHLRDEQLWFPWDERRRASAKQGAWAYDVTEHYAHFVGAAKQIENYAEGWRVFFDYLSGNETLPRVVSSTSAR